MGSILANSNEKHNKSYCIPHLAGYDWGGGKGFGLLGCGLSNKIVG